MKAKKIGMTAVTAAALLMMAMLVTNCAQPVSISNDLRDTLPTAPAGMGYVRFDLNRSVEARTLIPTAPALDTLRFTVEFTASDHGEPGGGYNVAATPVEATPIAAPPAGRVSLAPMPVVEGLYSYVIIRAYTADGPAFDDLGVHIATGTYTNFTVSSGNIIDLAMHGILHFNPAVHGILAPADIPTGTFNWNFTLPPNATGGTMTLEPLQGQGPVMSDVLPGPVFPTFPAPLALTPGANTDTATVPIGFYRMVITASGDSTVDSRTHSQIVHIYQGLTTNAAPTIAALNTILMHTLTFVDADASGLPAGNVAVTGRFAQFLAPLIAALTPSLPTLGPPATEISGLTFDGWFTTAAFTTPFTWDATTRLTSTMSVFARWLNGVGISLTPIEIADHFPVQTGVTVFRTLPTTPVVVTVDLDTDVAGTELVPGTLNASIANPDGIGGLPTEIPLVIGGAYVAPATSSVHDPVNSSLTFSFAFTGDHLFLLGIADGGTFPINIEVYDNVSPNPYRWSGSITVTVQNAP